MLAVSIAAAAGFGAIAFSLGSTWLARLDQALLGVVQSRWGPTDSRGSRKLQTILRDVTALGGDTLTVFLLLVGAGALTIGGRTDGAIVLAAIIITGRLAGALAKAFFRRSRPKIDVRHIETFTSSFPSVHTLMAFANMFAALSAVGLGAALVLVPLCVAAVLSALVGFTRFYFAAHWASDVMAGWLAGLAICAMSVFLLPG